MIQSILLSAVVALAAGPSDYDKAKVLQKVDQMGFHKDQISTLYDASRACYMANQDALKATDALAKSEANLNVIAKKLAAGQELTADESKALLQADDAREKIDADKDKKIDAAVDEVIKVLRPDQRQKLELDKQDQNKADQIIQQIQGVPDDQWGRQSRRFARQISGPEFDKVRSLYNSKESGLTRQDKRTELRQQGQAMNKWAQDYLSKIRSGDQATIEDFKRRYQADHADNDVLRDTIRDLITNDAAAFAILDRIKATS